MLKVNDMTLVGECTRQLTFKEPLLSNYKEVDTCSIFGTVNDIHFNVESICSTLHIAISFLIYLVF